MGFFRTYLLELISREVLTFFEISDLVGKFSNIDFLFRRQSLPLRNHSGNGKVLNVSFSSGTIEPLAGVFLNVFGISCTDGGAISALLLKIGTRFKVPP